MKDPRTTEPEVSTEKKISNTVEDGQLPIKVIKTSTHSQDFTHLFKYTLDHPLLVEDESRFCIFPIHDADIWAMYKKAVASFWTAEEIDFKNEHEEFIKLNAGEQHFIKQVLAFFAASDGIVNENLVQNFYNEVQMSEARNFYAFQTAMEAIHGEVYSLLIDTYVKDSEEKHKMFNALDNYPTIRQKADWALKWMVNKKAPLALRLCAFSIVEGIFFSGSFAAIFWLKDQGQRIKLHALTFSNEMISRDEGLHTDFACLLFRKLCPSPTEEEQNVIIEMVKEAVEIEKEFFTGALPVNLIGMNCKQMCTYIEFVSDRLLKDLIGRKYFNVTNPFQFMENISMEGKTNFFERRVGEYQKMDVTQGRDSKFDLDADF